MSEDKVVKMPMGQRVLMRAMSTLLSRSRLAGRLGLQFGGDRDLYEVFGYKSQPTFDDYLAKYVRQDIARRIIDAPALATWRNPPVVKGPQQFVNQWEKLLKVHPVWDTLERADKLAGLGQFSCLMLGVSGNADSDATSARRRGGERLLYMQVFSERSTDIPELEDDPNNPRFGLPKMYKFEVGDPTNAAYSGQTGNISRQTRRIDVNWTRVVHIAEGRLEDDIIGIPRMAPVFNRLYDLEKVAGGSAETYWLSGRQGLQADIDPEMELNAEDASNLADEIDEYMHQLRRVIRTRGVTLNTIGSTVPDPKGTFEVLLNLISGATGIPQRILLGAEAGQLASEQDRANWAERINERRGSFAEPVVLKPFIRQLAVIGVLPDPGESLEFEWPDAFNMNPLEESQLMAQQGRAIVNISRQNQFGQPIVSTIEARRILGLPDEVDGELPKMPSVEEEEDRSEAGMPTEQDRLEQEQQRQEDMADEGEPQQDGSDEEEEEGN